MAVMVLIFQIFRCNDKPVAIFSYVSIMLRVQNENVIRISKLQILNEAIKNPFHHIQVHLPQRIFTFPVGEEHKIDKIKEFPLEASMIK